MRQSLRTHPLASLQAASGARSVIEELHDSRFLVSAAIVFHRVGLLGRTMGFKKVLLIDKSFLIPIVLPSSPTLRMNKVPEWGWREARYHYPMTGFAVCLKRRSCHDLSALYMLALQQLLAVTWVLLSYHKSSSSSSPDGKTCCMRWNGEGVMTYQLSSSA